MEAIMKHLRPVHWYGCGTFARVTVSLFIDRSETPWDALRDALAFNYDLDPGALAITESYWGGEYGDSDGAELVTYEGQLIGSFTRALTAAEFDLLQTIPHFGDVSKTTDAERATL
jgi:hypothetical protein